MQQGVRTGLAGGCSRITGTRIHAFCIAGTLALGLSIASPVALPGPQAGLLDLPFEDLLDVEIRSAGKRDEQIRDIPASVTILSREEIARYGWVTFEELLRNVPGFFVLDNIEDRFIGNRGTTGGGVQFLVNGVPQHPSRQKALTVPEIARLNIPVESIDRIEVIRGPMSVIYGNNAFLGVINVVTNEIGLNGPLVSASAGSRDSGRLFARAGSASEDAFFVLNAGGYRTDGLEADYADMMGPDQLAALVPGMHTSLDGDVDQKDISLDVSAGWQDWYADLRYSEKKYGIYAFTPSFDDGNQTRLKTWHAALGWEHRLSEHLGLRTDAIVSEERVEIPELDFISPAFNGSQQQQSRRWELEFNLLWDPRDNLNLLAGYRLQRMDDIENDADLDYLARQVNTLDAFTVHDLFAELGWSPTARLRFVGGLRVSRLPDSYDYTSRDYLNNTRLEEDVDVDDLNIITGRIAALYSLDTQQVLKLIYGTAAQDNDQIQLTDPERIKTAEINYVQTRSDWSLSASLFQNRISNIVRTIQQLDNAGMYQTIDDNSGEWKTNGLELIGELRPLDGLNLAASATWQHTEDRKSDIDPGYSPQLLLKFKADYTRGPFTYAAYANYVDDMDADWDFVDGTTQGITERIGEEVDAYWDLGANLRYRHPSNGFYAALNVSNLLDTEIRYPANELTDFYQGLIGPGRVFTATVGWEF
jgi:outer membrane receptor protein involved in Fe transport